MYFGAVLPSSVLCLFSKVAVPSVFLPTDTGEIRRAGPVFHRADGLGQLTWSGFVSQQLTLTEKTNGTLEVEIKYVNPNENTDSLSSKLFGAENSHTFKQRNLKETQDFGRGFK